MITKTGYTQSPAFTSLIISDSIKLNKNKNVMNNFNSIKNAILDNKLDRKRNVDIILDYNKSEDKFYGVISSKKQGIPENPSSICDISTDKKSINIFKKWVNAWNKAYSPKELDNWHKLLSMITGK